MSEKQTEFKTLLEQAKQEKKVNDEIPRFLAKGDMVTINLKDFVNAKKESVEKEWQGKKYNAVQYTFPVTRNGGTKGYIMIGTKDHGTIVNAFETQGKTEILYMRTN